MANLHRPRQGGGAKFRTFQRLTSCATHVTVGYPCHGGLPMSTRDTPVRVPDMVTCPGPLVMALQVLS